MRRRLAMALLVGLGSVGLATTACGRDPFAPGDILVGRWGGQGIRLDFTADSVTATFDCAFGALEAPVVLGADRRFTAEGEYVREVGPAELPNPATYHGRLAGASLALTITVVDTLGGQGSYEAGPFTATLDRAGVTFACQ